jgi:para-aminobenzoate synthetase component 1
LPKDPRLYVDELPHVEDTISIFEARKNDRMSFLLDSAMQMDKYGRYSIIGSNPRVIVKSKNGVTEVNERGAKTVFRTDPLSVVSSVIEKFGALADYDNIDLPFTGGAVGYFGYDLNRQLERIPNIAIDDQGLPDIYLGFYDEAIIVDGKEKRTYVVYFDTKDSTYSDHEAGRRIKNIAESLRRSIGRSKKTMPESERYANSTEPKSKRLTEATAKTILRDLPGRGLISNFSREEYKRAIDKAKQYISAGDIFQVNLAQRYCFSFEHDHLLLYKRLRQANPAPFAAFMKFDGFSILSSSPERFMTVNRKQVQTRPIKGTRPRYDCISDDKATLEELLSSEKDAAEHVMIVDVKRNDLGKVCETGSVKVPELMVPESYESVHHLVSTVTGQLKDGAGPVELIRASFPGGSITGAPKIRAMEIIEELEPHRRNVYCGSIGYISTNGKMDTNIAIRTITAIGDKCYTQVGGGIVADSDPDDEYEETLQKGLAIFRAVGCD